MLSGIGKIYNWRKYEFPLQLSIESVLDGADEFVLAVCTDSQDDTVEYCRALEMSFAGRLKLVYSKWIEDSEEGKFNMRRLANMARDKAKSDWFLSVDMDEVYRPGEIKYLVGILNTLPLEFGGASVNFIHHYIDIRHRIFGKLYDRSARVGRKTMGWGSYDDGFGLVGKGQVFITGVTCNHYGFVRPARVGIEKELNFQETLYKPLDSQFPDPRLVDMNQVKNKIGEEEFYRRMMGEKDFLVGYNGAHWPGIEEWSSNMYKIEKER
jgi:hypothetical protein